MLVAKTCRCSLTMSRVIVNRQQFSCQRHGRVNAGRPAAAAERPLKRLTKLGAERRVQDEVDGAVDNDE